MRNLFEQVVFRKNVFRKKVKHHPHRGCVTIQNTVLKGDFSERSDPSKSKKMIMKKNMEASFFQQSIMPQSHRRWSS